MSKEYAGEDKHKKYLYEWKQDKLIQGENIVLTPNPDGKTVTISSVGGGGTGTITDVLVNNVSAVDQYGVAHIDLFYLQDQINDIMSVLHMGYWQDENDDYITDENGLRILFT